jgi:hypothetical protein
LNQQHTALVNRILMRFSARPALSLFKMHTGVARALTGDYYVKYGILGGTDIIGILKPNGRWVAIEVKVGKDDLGPKQRHFRQLIEEHGGLYVLARDLSDVDVALTNAA